MTTRTCKFGCDVLLGEWNDNARKYHEAATGELHTRERCEEAKANARRTQGANNHNDHGNEQSMGQKVMQQEATRQVENYVDHTAKPTLIIKTIYDPTPEGFDLKYNNFAKEHKIQFSQYQLAPSLYTMVVWYES